MPKNIDALATRRTFLQTELELPIIGQKTQLGTFGQLLIVTTLISE